MVRIIILLLLICSCGTFKTVNSPYTTQLLWAKNKVEDVYIFNNYYHVTKEFYYQYRVGDEFKLNKNNLIK